MVQSIKFLKDTDKWKNNKDNLIDFLRDDAKNTVQYGFKHRHDKDVDLKKRPPAHFEEKDSVKEGFEGAIELLEDIHTAIEKGAHEIGRPMLHAKAIMNYTNELQNAAKKELPKNKKYCGIAGNLGTSETETPNTPFEGEYRDDSLLARYADYSDKPIDGERAVVFYTEIQKKYKYPEFAGENFVTPAVPWNRMANDGYIMRFFNDIIWVYEYQPDGLTASGSKRFLERPRAYGLWLREKAEFCHYSLKKKLMMYYTFYCDMSERYSKNQIAEFIGAPKIVIYLSAFVHKLKHLSKKK
jgi:mRNA-degrading endonuclease YafQ of YafQ-DinJ toxin-antitoxin module